MDKYLIEFYDDYVTNDVSYKSGIIYNTTKIETFKLIELSHRDNFKMCIYEARIICDLS